MIAYYVHHHGSGHLHRAATIAAHTDTPVLGLSSMPAPAGWAGPWIELPPDDDGVDPADADRDVTAGSTLHWAPTGHDGFRRRMSMISDALAEHPVELLVADVSVEVAVLARCHGVPVVVMAQPGERTDRPHSTAYDLATRLLAPWPESPEPGWPARWRSKTVHLGAFSRFDRRLPVRPAGTTGGRRVLVLWGAGGVDVGTADIQSAAAHTPDWNWDVVGLAPPDRPGPDNLSWRGWVADVWSSLCAADVVVTHAGQNALAEV
ncbi:MAG TPA: glycosyl transferase, partial [Pseudonocardia sp.]